MNALLQWIDDRTGLPSAAKKCFARSIAGGACWCKIWPAAILFAFCVQAITGFFLWVYYSPSAQTAWEGVHYLQNDVLGGWLLRAVHHYGAHVLLALLIVYIVQTILTGAFRAPRELVFWMAVGMGCCALAAVLTGDLLSWDQNGYASTKTRTGFLTLLPLVGEGLLRIAIGGPGPALGSHTLTRFFALHVGVFAAGLLVLLILHAVFSRRADATAAAAGQPATAYWPNQAWRDGLACLVVLAVILALACQHGVTGPHAGAPLGSPADTNPANAYAAARPEWFLTGVYEFSHLFPGESAILAIFVIPGLLVCLVLAMPFIARWRKGQRFNVACTAVLLVAAVALTIISWAKDAFDEDHQAAIAAEKEQADRAGILAAHEGIPPTGALTLLLNDPKTEGRKLFQQHCASCHDWINAEGKGIKAKIPEGPGPTGAPNLYRFASPQWIEGILTRDRIIGPEYFGNTKFKNGRMVGHIKELWKDAEKENEVPELKEDIQKIALALSAQADLHSRLEPKSEAGPVDRAVIAEGERLIMEIRGCTTCHRFGDKPGVPKVPHLTGYGSRAWIKGIISNPADPQFYGKADEKFPTQGNDRMPAYAEILSARDLDLLTEWLRGEWYEEE